MALYKENYRQICQIDLLSIHFRADINSFSFHGTENRAVEWMSISEDQGASQRKNSENKWDWYYKTGLKLTIPTWDQEPGNYANFYWKQGAYQLEMV